MSKKTIYVTGHKNPDTDAIVSAIAYAYLKQQQGLDAIAVRLGNINPETEYILNYFNEFAPPLAKDIRARVRDIDFDDALYCLPSDDARTVLNKMNETGIKTAVISDGKRHLIGLASRSDITEPAFVNPELRYTLLQKTSIDYLANAIKGEIVVNYGNHSNGRVYVATHAMLDCEDKIVVVSDNAERHVKAINAKTKVLVICGGNGVAEEVIELANAKQCSIIATDMDIYTSVGELDFAFPVEYVMSTNIVTISYNEYVEDVKKKVNKSRYRSYPVVDASDRVIGMISRFHVIQNVARNLILVDHNEFNQSIDGAEEANILEIIDHHRIGGLKTASPVFFRNEQVGCCSTIISEMFDEYKIEIPDDLAGMMCCAIISDTVNFKSVTCTETDIREAKKLAKIAGLDLEDIAIKVLKAGTKLANRSMESIFTRDSKRFEIQKQTVVIAQANIIAREEIDDIRDEMSDFLTRYAKDRGIDIVIMAFSLIDGTGSYILYKGDSAKAVEFAFDDISENVNGFLWLPKVMSRKLQIVPRLTRALENN